MFTAAGGEGGGEGPLTAGPNARRSLSAAKLQYNYTNTLKNSCLVSKLRSL